MPNALMHYGLFKAFIKDCFRIIALAQHATAKGTGTKEVKRTDARIIFPVAADQALVLAAEINAEACHGRSEAIFAQTSIESE